MIIYGVFANKDTDDNSAKKGKEVRKISPVLDKDGVTPLTIRFLPATLDSGAKYLISSMVGILTTASFTLY